jgi:tetratricopeptide (TPR) repeat protein
MANISLRAYNREISNLIDRGQTDEAVAHCQYILQYYPKYIETYRLLGKAYLEGHHHAEAMDVFQRILTVAPDDFITQVGMSIIREDEGNLAASIWHMERAFETQPSNQAIQDELKHLYGKRDGEEPLKIRLTRGALCRMYARGNQYRQAVAEIKSLLAESPDRVDLEVLLARMYYNLNMKVEATELCGRLLNKFPHCLEANKIMLKILEDSGKKPEGEPYKQKIIHLDPYETMVNDQYQSSEQVPEDMIPIEKLVYDPNQKPVQPAPESAPKVKEEAAPDWVLSDLAGADQDLGEKGFTRILDSSNLPSSDQPEDSTPENVKVTESPVVNVPESVAPTVPSTEDFPSTQQVEMEPQDDELPNWLKDTEKSAEESETEIPDWLKASGWAAAGSIQEDAPPTSVIHLETEPEPADVPIVPADIPDWVQGLAPAFEEMESEPLKPDAVDDVVSEETSNKLNDWLSGEQPPQDAAVAGGTASLHLPNEEEEPESGTPDWLKGLEDQGKPSTEQALVFKSDASTEWQPESPAPVSASSHSPQTDKLDMDDIFPAAGGTSILSPDDVPDWLQDLSAVSEEEKLEPPEAPKVINVEAPTQPAPRSHEQAPEIVTTNLPQEEVAPDWLAGIPIETSEKATAVLPETSEESDGSMPSWLSMLDQDTPEDSGQTEVSKASEAPIDIPSIQKAEPELPESVEVIPDSEEERPTTSILPPNPEDLANELPDWLKELDGYPEGTSPIADSAEDTTDEFPDWLKGFSENEPSPQAPITPASLEESQAEESEVPNWLSDLDLKGSSVESTVVEIPDWLKGLEPEPEPSIDEMSVSDQEIPPTLESEPESPDLGEVFQTAEMGIIAESSVEKPQETVEPKPISTADLLPFDVEPVSEITQEEISPVENVPVELQETMEVEEQLPTTELPVEVSEPSPELESAEQPVAETVEPLEISEDQPEMVIDETVPEVMEVAPVVEEVPEYIAEESTAIESEEIQSIETVEEPIMEAEQVEDEVKPVETIAEIETFAEEVPVPAAETTVVEEMQAPIPEPVAVEEPVVVENLKELDKIYNQGVKSIKNGDLETAQEQFSKLISKETHLEKIIEQLSKATEAYPTDFGLWMTLGDALGRSGKLQTALDAYIKAEEYLQ